jgi:short-subunit dehydrogenase involved in D-alanine esterification of teichoic acids
LSEAEDFGRKVFVKRKGRLTPIDSPDMFLQLQKATKDAKNRYAKALREKSKRTGIKVSDVFFYAIFEEGENTIIDIDSIEYTGLTENEIQKAGLR